VADDMGAQPVADRDGMVTLADVALPLAWNLRGNPADASFVISVEQAFGLPLPAEPMTSRRTDRGALFWLGPRSWLFVGASAAAGSDFDATRIAINVAGGALFDVSASYAAWTISGVRASRVLNRLCPLDLHDRSFVRGRCAQTVLGHINALVHRPGDSPTFVVMVARSLAADAWDALCAASASDGYRVGACRPFHAVAR
jgi:sarcosine oxidase, subunit gamma